MARLTFQENPDGVASRDVCNSDNSVRNAIHTSTTSGKQSGQSPSHSSDNNLNSNSIDCETTVIDALLRRFLISLNAKEVTGPRGCCTFILQPGAYAKTLESLHKSDSEVWGYISSKLR